MKNRPEVRRSAALQQISQLPTQFQNPQIVACKCIRSISKFR